MIIDRMTIEKSLDKAELATARVYGPNEARLSRLIVENKLIERNRGLL